MAPTHFQRSASAPVAITGADTISSIITGTVIERDNPIHPSLPKFASPAKLALSSAVQPSVYQLYTSPPAESASRPSLFWTPLSSTVCALIVLRSHDATRLLQSL